MKINARFKQDPEDTPMTKVSMVSDTIDRGILLKAGKVVVVSETSAERMILLGYAKDLVSAKEDAKRAFNESKKKLKAELAALEEGLEEEGLSEDDDDVYTGEEDESEEEESEEEEPAPKAKKPAARAKKPAVKKTRKKG